MRNPFILKANSIFTKDKKQETAEDACQIKHEKPSKSKSTFFPAHK